MFMHVLISHHYILSAIHTLASSATTLNLMIMELLERKRTLTITALLWFKITVLFMIPKLSFNCLKVTILTFYLYMCLSFMLLSITLLNNFATFFTFVIVSSTANIMHPEFAHRDITFAGTALLCWFFFSFHFL